VIKAYTIKGRAKNKADSLVRVANKTNIVDRITFKSCLKFDDRAKIAKMKKNVVKAYVFVID
jgi:hypothetical protein